MDDEQLLISKGLLEFRENKFFLTQKFLDEFRLTADAVVDTNLFKVICKMIENDFPELGFMKQLDLSTYFTLFTIEVLTKSGAI